jgi:hypothetical protein
MQRIHRKKCPCCRALFTPDARNLTRQRFCSKPACQKQSKAESQRKWLQKDQNRGYFRGSVHVQRVQLWRKNNPGYWRGVPHCPLALQDPSNAQPSANNANIAHFEATALQDALIMQPAVMVGLIAQLTGLALQDDIARAARRMQQLGNDILYPPP